jgi:hypothetical protein
MPNPGESRLWANEKENFFGDRVITPKKQMGKHTIATVLAILSGEKPEFFQEKVNTQDPVSWSDSLEPFGMKLAYCPYDIRKVHYYMDELISYNDLFLICYYNKGSSIEDIMKDPDSGFVCGSHVVILHHDRIIDSKRGDSMVAKEHECMQAHTKRLFRVVPANYKRGI